MKKWNLSLVLNRYLKKPRVDAFQQGAQSKIERDVSGIETLVEGE
jgi:hypothetical protein